MKFAKISSRTNVFNSIFEWDKGIEPSDACRVEVCRAPPATLIPHVELTL